MVILVSLGVNDGRKSSQVSPFEHSCCGGWVRRNESVELRHFNRLEASDAGFIL
jgi:hypothetical protein